MNNAPIGMFDSGIGGLTVAREVFDLLPNETVIYFGDTARYPYGPRTAENIRGLSVQITEFLLEFDIKMLVIACNTATAAALELLRGKFPELPMLGVIQPGAKGAILSTRNNRIGVIGTDGTIASGVYQNEIQDKHEDITVISKPCPLFVPLAEEGWINCEATKLIAETYLDELKNQDIDTLILGCTHYPLLTDIISETMGKDTTIINSAMWTARSLFQSLQDRGLAADAPDGFSRSRFFVSDAEERFRRVGEPFLRRPLPAVEKKNFS